jgi:hypothetical protein
MHRSYQSELRADSAATGIEPAGPGGRGDAATDGERDDASGFAETAA